MATDLNSKLNLDKAITNLDALIGRVETLNSTLITLNQTTNDTAKQQDTLNTAQSDSKKIVEDLTTEEIELAKLQDKVVASAEKLTGVMSEENEQLIKNRVATQNANKEIRANAKAQLEADTATQNANKAYAKSVKTIRDAEKQNKALRIAVKNVDTTTEQGQKTIAKYNKRIEENDDIINQSSDSFVKQKRNIGAYETALDGVKGGFTRASTAAKALLKNPIIALIAGIAAAFRALSESVKRSEKATAAFNKIGAIFSGIWNGVLEALTPVVEAIGTTLVQAFENPKQAFKDLGDTIKENFLNRIEAIGVFGDAISALFRGEFSKSASLFADATVQAATGITDATDKAKDFVETVEDTTKATIAASSAERDRVKAAIEFQKTQLIGQKLAEDQRQIRDDVARSIDERIAANNKLSQLLDEQLEKELKLANQQVELAKQQQKANGETITSIQAIGNAEIKVLEIQERISGFRAEQLIEVNGLLSEQKDRENELFALNQANIDEAREKDAERREEDAERLEEEEEAELEKYLADEKRREEAATKEAELIDVVNAARTLGELDYQETALNVASTLFDADKRKALKTAFINIREGVTKAWAQGGIFGAIGAALVAAQGAIQIASISGISGFYKGTKNAPKGLAMVSERGAELVESSDGTLRLIPDMSLINLEGGETIYTAKETKQMMFDDKRIVDEIKRQKTTVIVNVQRDSFNYKYRMKA